MLKLKTTFYLYNNEINEQIKKSITSKYIDQIAQCVLTDITENSEQAGTDMQRNGSGDKRGILAFSNMSVTIRPQNGIGDKSND